MTAKRLEKPKPNATSKLFRDWADMMEMFPEAVARRYRFAIARYEVALGDLEELEGEVAASAQRGVARSRAIRKRLAGK